MVISERCIHSKQWADSGAIIAQSTSGVFCEKSACRICVWCDGHPWQINTLSVSCDLILNNFYVINKLCCVIVTNTMEDDDTVGSFEICIVDEFRINGIWKR